MVLSLLASVLALLYGILMLAYRQGWRLQGRFIVPVDFDPRTHIAVVVPARDEAANIRACLDALVAQDYPRHLLQVVVVDDHSEDETAALAGSYADCGVRCLRLADYPVPAGTVAYKKRALALAVAAVPEAELIVTTDADCTAGPQWLRTLAARYELERPVTLVGPVAYTCDDRVVQVFQALDFASMQGITMAAHRLGLGTMGNGANLAFGRAAFDAVGGYAGTDHLASGDDYLLLHKLSTHFPGRIAVVPASEAVVYTAPQPTWRAFLQQRIRWASKSGKYPDHRLTAILLLVYLFNVVLVVLAGAALVNAGYGFLAIGLLFFKTAVESFFLRPVLRYFGQLRLWRWFPLLQPMHILYVVLAGFLGLWGTYRWKGRRVR